MLGLVIGDFDYVPTFLNIRWDVCGRETPKIRGYAVELLLKRDSAVINNNTDRKREHCHVPPCASLRVAPPRLEGRLGWSGHLLSEPHVCSGASGGRRTTRRFPVDAEPGPA